MELLMKKELATLLRISERTLDRYRSAGLDLGEVALSARCVRFSRSKVEAAIAQGRFKKKGRSRQPGPALAHSA
jgi:hypothetical protein